LGSGEWSGLVAEPLISADLTPVAAPAVASVIQRPQDLNPERLLRVAHAEEDWPRWLSKAGAPGIKPMGPVFDYYGQAIQAATDGLGVAIGIRPYIDDDLIAGRLVRPFDLTIPQGQKWHFVYQSYRLEDPLFRRFRD
ncbi:MAG: LysR substrate-binding domain-containing protein, partial [Alphaproteobacteria bacterium]